MSASLNLSVSFLQIQTFYDSFDSRVPKLLQQELRDLKARLELGSEHPPPTNNAKLIEWVEKVRKLTKPSRVHWCTGTQEEYDEMCHLLEKQGTFIKLNPLTKYVYCSSFSNVS